MTLPDASLLLIALATLLAATATTLGLSFKKREVNLHDYQLWPLRFWLGAHKYVRPPFGNVVRAMTILTFVIGLTGLGLLLLGALGET